MTKMLIYKVEKSRVQVTPCLSNNQSVCQHLSQRLYFAMFNIIKISLIRKLTNNLSTGIHLSAADRRCTSKENVQPIIVYEAS